MHDERKRNDTPQGIPFRIFLELTFCLCNRWQRSGLDWHISDQKRHQLLDQAGCFSWSDGTCVLDGVKLGSDC